MNEFVIKTKLRNPEKIVLHAKVATNIYLVMESIKIAEGFEGILKLFSEYEKMGIVLINPIVSGDFFAICLYNKNDYDYILQNDVFIELTIAPIKKEN